MFERSRAAVPGALLIAIAVVLAACGGGATATATPTPVAPGATTPTPAAEATPTPEGADGEATPGLALPTFDLEALTGGLPGVDSYRTETSVGGVLQYESVVVTRPVLSKAISVYDDGEVTQRFVIIGEEVWIADGAGGAFEADTTGFGSTILMAFDPALMLGAWTNVDWAGAGANQGVEEKNGVQAHHVRIDSTTFIGAAGAMPPGASVDIWVADAGYLVAWEMSGFPDDANFAIEVTNVNDPSNKVERPG